MHNKKLCTILVVIVTLVAITIYMYQMNHFTINIKTWTLINVKQDLTREQLDNISVIESFKYTDLQQLLRFWTKMTQKSNTVTSLTADVGPSLKEVNQLASRLDSIQFYKRDELSKNKKLLTSISGYRYNFLSNMFTDSNSEIRSITFTIQEVNRDLATSGGATFHIIVSGATTRSMCNYQDQFNGNYTVCCPVIDAQNNSIQIQLMNVQFHSYKLHRSHNKVIGILNYYTTSNASSTSTNTAFTSAGVFIKHVSLLATFVCDTSYWQRAPSPTKDANWVRKHSPNKKMKSVSKEKLSKCMLEKYNKVLFVGDSHIRYVYMYTKSLLGYMKKSETGRDMVDKDLYKTVKFVFVTYAEGYAKALDIVENELKIGDKILILTSLGAWDTHYKTPTSFVKGVQSGLKKLELIKQKYAIDVIWQTIPPVSQAIEHSVGAYGKVKLSNTFVNSALNMWLSSWLESIGVHVIDLLEIARAIKNEDVCGGHYLCITPQRTMFGVGGLEATRQILETVC